MRLISMVPSWTETLLECGLNVVGRSRYCIHPADRVRDIPIVGGTKDIRWDRVRDLQPDLLVLDREENPLSMAQDSPFPTFDSQILQVQDVQRDLLRLGQRLGSPALQDLGRRWAAVSSWSQGQPEHAVQGTASDESPEFLTDRLEFDGRSTLRPPSGRGQLACKTNSWPVSEKRKGHSSDAPRQAAWPETDLATGVHGEPEASDPQRSEERERTPPEKSENTGRNQPSGTCLAESAALLPDLADLPGVLQWIRKPGPAVDRLVYVIWKDPWMAVSPGTFIGSVLQTLGYGPALVPFETRYPTFQPETLDTERTLLLFSSEPFPFGRHPERLAELPFASALVDGEVFSWFGLRSLRFLERTLGILSEPA